MIERISTKILDILQADARLLASGNAYATGWTAVTREESGGVPASGSINLFDKAYDPDGGGHRPAIYVGTRAMEASDDLDFPTCSAGARIEYRVMLIPLVVACQAPTKYAARQQRNQLRHNVKVILLGNILLNNYWYEMTVPGRSAGGGASERVWTTSTGGASQQVSEAIAIVPVQVRYSWSATAFA